MLNGLRYRLRAIFRRAEMERELEAEMEHAAAGGAREAELEAVREACRDTRGIGVLESAQRNLRFAARSLRRSWGFTTATVLTLALGIGAATAIFTLADTALLHPVPYPDAGSLRLVRERLALLTPFPVGFSPPDIGVFQHATRSLTGVAAFNAIEMDLTGAGVPARIEVTEITSGLLPLLLAAPLAGRNFTRAEDTPGHRVAILSYGLWRSRFGGSRGIVGRAITLGGQPYTVVGVMPRAFTFPPRGLPDYTPAQVWTALAFTPAQLADVADHFGYGVLARQRRGLGEAEANADVALAGGTIQRFWHVRLGRLPAGLNVEVMSTPLAAVITQPVRTLMLLLLAAAGLLLLMSCANAANLFLVRASTRRRELALRAALGAGRRRLVGQLLWESGVLAAAAATLAIGLAWGMVRVLAAAAPDTLPQVQGAGLGWAALGFALVVALGAGMVCGLLPALHVAPEAGGGLDLLVRDGSRGTGQARSGVRLRNSLIVAQVAAAFVLAGAAGLLIHSYLRAEASTGGVQPAGIVTAGLALPATEYRSPAAVESLYRRLADSIDGQPGVSAFAAASDLPTQANWQRAFTIEGTPANSRAPLPVTDHALVLGGYLQASGVSLLAGRWFTRAEEDGQAQVVLVSDSLARKYWPRGNVVGRRFKWGALHSGSPWLTVIGVVGNVDQGGLDEPGWPQSYEPYAQTCTNKQNAFDTCRSLHLVLRSRLPEPQAATLLRRKVRALAPDLPLTRIRTMRQVLDSSITPRRFNTLLLAVFGGSALLLAGLGLYALLAFMVAGERQEIGVRMALGATRTRVAGGVTERSLRLIATGLAIGGAAAWPLAQLAQAMLYRTSTDDPAVWAAVAGLLLLAGLAASLIPALRAASVDPARVLRQG